MMKFIHIIFIILLITVSCGNSSDNETDSTDTLPSSQPKKSIDVGIYVYDYPFGYLSNGIIGGFDYDLMHEIADASDFEIQFVPMQFSDLIPSLRRDDIDIIIAAMSITEERKQLVNFSDRYLTAGQSIVVNKGNTNIKTTNDLAEKTVGVIKDTVSDMIISKTEGIHQIERFDIAGSALLSLKRNKIDAIMIDKLTCINYIQYDKDLTIVQTIEYPEIGYGIAVRKDDYTLLHKVNSGLQEIMTNGTYQKLVDKYL